jgi:outer membrane protein X
MVKLITTAVIVCVLSLSAHAQVRVAPFLGYGNELGLWGLGGQVELLLNERLSITPVFMQYFPEDLDNAPRRTAWEVNGNVNYYVINGEVGYLYGLAGVNYTHIKIRTRTAFTDEIENDNNVGLNFGLGSMVRINDLVLPFVEAKYTVGGYSQLSVMAGVKFQLGGDTLDEDY